MLSVSRVLLNRTDIVLSALTSNLTAICGPLFQFRAKGKSKSQKCACGLPGALLKSNLGLFGPKAIKVKIHTKN